MPKLAIPVIVLLCGKLAAQSVPDSIPFIRVLDINQRQFRQGDSIWLSSGICKPLKHSLFLSENRGSSSSHITGVQRQLLLTGSGDLTYQHYNRSGNSSMLPLLQSRSDIAALRLRMIYKERIPFFISFRYNQSSPFQPDNIYEFNIGYDERGYKEIIREKILSALQAKQVANLSVIQRRYTSLYRQYQEQKEILESPAYIQQQIESRFSLPPVSTVSLTGADSLTNPGFPQRLTSPVTPVSGLPVSLPFSYIKGLPKNFQDSLATVKNRWIDSVRKKAPDLSTDLHKQLVKRKDSLEKLYQRYEDSLASYKKKYRQEIDSVNRELADLETGQSLRKYGEAKGVKDSAQLKGLVRFALNSHIRLGKFILNQSELTINNIFLHGVSIRCGEERFVQLSAGYYDFAFREMFRLRRDTMQGKRQSVMGIKVGKTDGKNLQAFSFYIGRKERSSSLHGALRTVAGMSAERTFYFSKHFQAGAEIAKSTTRFDATSSLKETGVLKDLFGSIRWRSVGVNGWLRGHLPATKTDAEISYRYLGQQFESFNASQYFNPQNNLSAKLSQGFFKRRLLLNAGVRYTDFRSYGIASNLKSKTVFATVNATMRIKKLPVLSVGYYPGSQLYLNDGNQLYEYFYYIFNVTASHYFQLKKVPVQAVLTHNKFYNRYTDSIVSAAQNYYGCFLTAWAGRFSFQANYTHQEMEAVTLTTAEAGAGYSYQKIRLSGTAKWNFFSGDMRMGYSASIGISFGKTGTLSCIYDRSFLPERSGVFIPVSTGQVQIIKPLNFRIWQKR